MDRIEKALRKLSEKERGALRSILKQILAGDVINLDVKKLKGFEGIFRIRKGSVRVIYRVDKTGEIRILTVERRSDTTYDI